MLKTITTLGLVAGVLLISRPMFAQADPTATALSNLQIGIGYTYARTDYGQKGDKGFTIFGDYDIGLHWGADAEYHYNSVSTPDSVSENSFVFGPRFIYRKRHFKLYGKGLIGAGKLNIPIANVHETDLVFGGGGGLEYLLGRHVTLRPVDFEYQHWSYSTGLTPALLTTGVAFRFH